MSIPKKVSSNKMRNCVLAIMAIVGCLSLLEFLAWQARLVEREHVKERSKSFDEGRQAAQLGVPVQACPYEGMCKSFWVRGWTEGFIEIRPK